MDWMEVVKVLGVPGALLLGGLVWLARDRARILVALAQTQKELGEEKDKRSTDLERNYQEFYQRGEALTKAITDFNSKAQVVLARVR